MVRRGIELRPLYEVGISVRSTEQGITSPRVVPNSIHENLTTNRLIMAHGAAAACHAWEG